MHRMRQFAALRRTLLAATVFTAAGAAQAQTVERPTGAEQIPGIIVNDTLDPNAPPPAGALDLSGIDVGLTTGVNGIGQMTVRSNPASTGLSLCTGTLINPRAVVFAAHCVNTRPASSYGVDGTPTGDYTDRGIPIAFGFGSDNLPAVRQWLGLASSPGGTDADPALVHATNEARALYAVEEVWYDPRSLDLGPGLGYLQADIAIATLDTPAFEVPTWTMLFSPLTEQAHSLSIGYGVNGTHSSAQGAGCPAPYNDCGPLGGIDFRRRAAENVLSVLGSLDDRDDFLFGPADPFLVQSLYMQDFDSLAGQAGYDPASGSFDFDIFDGGALPREGTTAGGDSGGPLVVDQKFDKLVMIGVLSGGSRFFNAQRFSTYGTHNFYQPLFLYWDAIVQNNPYVYAGNRAGIREWDDPKHWVQLMDPNYAVERGGVLVNDLPDTPAQGVSGNTPKFGQICFLDDCTNLADDPQAIAPPSGSGSGLVIAGGPGSTGFVPNNVTANPAAGVRARYYDVTLDAPGETRLGSDITIDRLALAGAHRLNIKTDGSLTVLGDYEQWVGWTHVDGVLKTSDMLVATGLLTGRGTLDPTYLTVAGGLVAPGDGLLENRLDTLTVIGDVIFSSGTVLLIDAGRAGTDVLEVQGDSSNPGQIHLAGTLGLTKARGAAPRHGQTFDVITATGGVFGTFDNVFSFPGVLRPTVTYESNAVSVALRAGKFSDFLRGAGAVAQAFGSALDALREPSYKSLYGLYGAVDLMGPVQLAATFENLTPKVIEESRSLQDDQNRVMLSTIGDRLSMLGTPAAAGKLSVVGAPEALALLGTGVGLDAAASAHGSTGLTPSSRSIGALPPGFSGFVSGGFTANDAMLDGGRASFQGGQRSWHIGMGLEMQVAEGATIGTAFGYTDGYSMQGGAGARADTRSRQVAIYGSYQLGGGFYVGGVAAAERSWASYERSVSSGYALFQLTGATGSARYSASTEAGVNLGIGHGVVLTPRVGIAYSSYHLDGFRESGGEVALQMDHLRLQQLSARFGAKLAGTGGMRVGGWSLLPQLQADYVRNLSGGNDGFSVRFAAAPEVAIHLPLAASDDSWAEVKGGLKLSKGPVELGAGLATSLDRANYRDGRATADFTYRF